MRSNRAVFFSACFGMLLFGASLITMGAVSAGLQAKFQLDNISSGALFSVLPLGILAGSLLFGPFSDRYGYKLIMVISSLGMLAGFEGIAFADSLNVLKICVFLFGCGGGAINGAANAVVADISKEKKGANLSLLGIFFAIGALGMPFILGILEQRFTFEVILSWVGLLTLIMMVVFMFTRFPEPKQKAGIPVAATLNLLREPFLLLIGFFLFCQSSFEAIINNWTTTFLVDKLSIPASQALYALSLYVLGMAIMRLIIGGVLRNVAALNILMIGFTSLLAGCILMQSADTYMFNVAGLILVGAGLAAGFPIMMGLVGNRYADLSATAIGIVIVISMIGNMLINYLMGVIAENYGIRHLTTLSFALLSLMILLSIIINRKAIPLIPPLE